MIVICLFNVLFNYNILYYYIFMFTEFFCSLLLFFYFLFYFIYYPNLNLEKILLNRILVNKQEKFVRKLKMTNNNAKYIVHSNLVLVDFRSVIN